MKNNDTQLIHRTLDGDDSAFAELVEKYQKQVHALVWRKIGDFHTAEEITQDTFLKAYKKLGTLKKPQRFASWLYVIAANRCNTWLHKKHSRKQLLEDKDITQPEEVTYSEYVVEENERITVETQRNVVQKLLAKLEESERTVMTLHYFGEMSCAEIGAFMGVSANTVKSRLRRAQQRLQKEETMIREALDNYQISPNLTENIIREISHTKPTTPTGGKPIVPWAMAVSTLAVVLLMIGFGNHLSFGIFQKPYSLDSTAEMKVEIVEALIVADLESKPNVPTQSTGANVFGARNNLEQQPNDTTMLFTETQADKIIADYTPIENYTQWELPKAAKARLGKGGIRSMQFSPDGSLLAVGSNIGVWLYDVNTGQELSLFPGACQSLAFSPDGHFLANGGGAVAGGSGRYHGEEVQLWEVSTGKRITLAKSPSPASVLLFSEDGKTLISLGDWGDTIANLNIETGEINIKTFRDRPKDRAYSESYALTHDKLAVGGVSGKIQLWDPISGKKLPIPRGDSEQLAQGDLQTEMIFEMGKNDHILGLAYSPDGSQLAIGSENGTVLLWDTTGNNEPIILRKHTGRANTLVSVRNLAFSPNGKMLASGDADNKVQLWDTGTGKILATLTGHIDGITALTFSPDGSTLASASADGEVLFWNTETNNPLPIRISDHPHTQRGMAILKDSITLASVAYNGIITIWDLKTQRKSNIHTGGHYDLLRSFAFSSDGTKLAIADQQLIYFIDVRTGRELARLTITMDRSASAMAVSPDRKTVAIGSSPGISLWNTDTGNILNMSPTDKSLPMMSQISTIIFSLDGKKLVSGDFEGRVQIWDAVTGEELTNLLKGDGIDNVIDLLGDGIDESMDNGIRFVFPINLITALTISADESLLAAGNFEKIRLFGNQKKAHFKEVSNVNCNALVFSPDETVLVVGLATGGIQLLDITTGDKLATLDGHTAPIVKFLFLSDGKTLVSTGYDGTILVWDWDEALKVSTEE